jgi:hypothetical protein
MYRDSSVGIATSLRAGQPRDWSSIPGRATLFSRLLNVQTGSKAHPPSYTVDKEGSFSRGKVVLNELSPGITLSLSLSEVI